MTVWGYILCAIILAACIVLLIITSFEIGLNKGVEFAMDMFDASHEEDTNEPL